MGKVRGHRSLNLHLTFPIMLCGKNNAELAYYCQCLGTTGALIYIRIITTGVDLSKILGGTRFGQSAITDDIIGVSGAT